jgi:prepilin-type N-terminal cleavage/methylation domain-containing protein
MNRKGFTLIELLVVIAIIAILAAILFPVFLSAKDKARTIKCMSHGKELGSASLMYMADNGDRFPSLYSCYSEAGYNKAVAYMASITWKYNWLGVEGTGSAYSQLQHIQLKRYVKNEAIWICAGQTAGYPSRYSEVYRCSWLPRSSDNFVNGDRGFTQSKPIPWPSAPDHQGNVGLTVGEVQSNDALGYVLNADGSRTQTACGKRYMPPSKKIMWMCYAIGRWGATAFGNPGPPWGKIRWPSYAHADGSVFVYADGHASFQRMGMGWAPLNYTTVDMDLHQ